jgi:predicted dehydrogenase
MRSTPVKIRVGLIGLGHWGLRLANALLEHPRYKLAFVCDEHARALENAPRGVPGSTNAADAVQYGLQALVLAVDPRRQGELAEQLTSSGLALFVEKPLAMSVACADRILQARRAGQVIFVDHLVQYMAIHERAQAWLQAKGPSNLRGVFSLRHGARERPGVDALWTLGPHDVSLLHSLGLGDGGWTAVRDERGRIIADSREDLASSAQISARFRRLWLGAAGPSQRVTLYFLADEALWLDESRGELRLVRTSPAEFTTLFHARDEYALRAVLGKLHEASQWLAECPALDALEAALSEFARAIQSQKPTRSDAEHGRAVVFTLEQIERALG